MDFCPRAVQWVRPGTGITNKNDIEDALFYVLNLCVLLYLRYTLLVHIFAL